MHSIVKGDPPECFAVETESLDQTFAWNEFKNPCKQETHDHILQQEQQGLCCYCESRIDLKGIHESHLEHVVPQSLRPERRFDYSNLAVSCGGKQCSERSVDETEQEERHSCGHRKENEHDEARFLNPLEEADVSGYFSFNKESGQILPATGMEPVEKSRAEYTIRLLGLDVQYLRNARRNAVKALLLVTKGRPELVNALLQQGEMAYPTFVRYYFGG